MSGPMHFKPMLFQEPSYLRASMPYRLRAVPGVLPPFPSELTHPLRGLPQGPREREFEKEEGTSRVDLLGVMPPGRVSQLRKERLPKAAAGLPGQEGWYGR